MWIGARCHDSGLEDDLRVIGHELAAQVSFFIRARRFRQLAPQPAASRQGPACASAVYVRQSHEWALVSVNLRPNLR